MNELRFEITFHDPGEADFPEDCTIADLGIAVDDDYLTRHERSVRPTRGGKEFSDTVHGPVAGLADWLIENWSFVLRETQTPFNGGKSHGVARGRPAIPGAKEAANQWEDYIIETNEHGNYASLDGMDDLARLADWQHRHLLGHARSDLAIPSIVVVPEGRTVLLYVDRLPKGSMPFHGPGDTPRVPTRYVIAKKDFRSAAADFVDGVIDRVHSIGQHARWAEWMRRRWQDAQGTESGPAEQLESMIGPVGARRVEDLRRVEPVVASGLRRPLPDRRIAEEAAEPTPVEQVPRRYGPGRSRSRGTRTK